MNRTRAGLWAALLVSAPAAASAAPEWLDKISFSGYVQSDIRFDVEDYRGVKDGDGYKFSTNRNDLDLRLEVTPIEQLAAVVDARLRFFGMMEVNTLVQTNDRNRVDPFSVQLDQAYLAVKGVPFKWMDLKLGRMVQTWGSADMFNPTDNINGHDFSDPMDFARKVPNQMVELDLYPANWLTINAVWVPMFKPSQLPSSASFGFAVERDAKGCLVGMPAPPLSAKNADALTNTFGQLDPCMLNFADPEVRTVLPSNNIDNSQVAVRARLRLGDLDLGLSYYYGRFSFPVAYTAVATTAPSASDPSKIDVNYVAEVMYPRIQVAGLDFSYTAPWMLDIGLVGEIALYFPEEVDFAVRAFNGTEKVLELRDVNVPSTPFIKATVGMDYAFTSWLMVNAMYIHGFFDEFNDRYGLHNYVALTPRLSFKDDSVKIQISAILDCDDLSNQVNPELLWIVVPGVEVSLGAWIYGGSTHALDKNGDGQPDSMDYSARSKFGQKASGRNVAYLRAKAMW
ncbi:MAG TPA: DUF1302 family protein [Myxococcales bacterium]|jgi:hypothetical protein